MDLAQYLCQHQGQLVAAQDAPPGLAFRGQKVIELGCGHGIPGLVALSQGAEVHFQVGCFFWGNPCPTCDAWQREPPMQIVGHCTASAAFAHRDLDSPLPASRTIIQRSCEK